ncbi:MAG: hypothetical protein V2A58_05880 [Planctomycetota bacterium]
MRLVFSLVFLLSVCGVCQAEVTVREEEWIGNQKLVIIENEHLRAAVAPAFGGRLLSLVHKASGTEIFKQQELTELPEVEGPVARALETIPRLVAPSYGEHWNLEGDIVLAGQPAWDFLSIKNFQLWGWLECFVDRGYGSFQGNEHHSAVWDYELFSSEGEAGVKMRYVTKLPPAPLGIMKSYALRGGESCVRARHEVVNLGERTLRFEYYSHGCFTPGGSFDEADRLGVPIRTTEGLVTPRIVPTFQDIGECVLFRPAASWFAFIDTAKEQLIVHRFSYECALGWTWQGRSMCSIEGVKLATLGKGETFAWDDALGVLQGFTRVTGVRDDLVSAIETVEKPEGVEVRVTVGSLAPRGQLAGELLLTPKKEGASALSFSINVPPGILAHSETIALRQDAADKGPYIARLRLRDETIAETILDTGRLAPPPATDDSRPVLWAAPPYVSLPAHLRVLYGLRNVVLPSTYALLPEMLDTEKARAVVFSDLGPGELKPRQCESILSYVSGGGRLLILPRGNSSFDPSNVLPRPQHLEEFFDSLGVGPAIGTRTNPNRVLRGYFRADGSSVAEHPLTKGLDWTKLEIPGFWRYSLGKDARVLVRLDTGDPLLVIRPLGKGEVILFCGAIDIISMGWSQVGEEMDEFLRRCLFEKL